MAKSVDEAYFTRRAIQARTAAACAGDPCVEIVHMQFAEAYDRRALECNSTSGNMAGPMADDGHSLPCNGPPLPQ